MKESPQTNKKYLVDFRKHSISQKTRSDITNPFRPKDEPNTGMVSHGIKYFGRKYVQQNLFKTKQKDHHEIVISDELVRNSKQFRMLRQKMQMKQAIFSKQLNQLNQDKCKLKQEIVQIKSSSYNSKLTLWELKNHILELKNILNEEEEQSRRLQKELVDNPPQQYYQEEEENQYNQQENYPNLQQQNHMSNEEQLSNNSLKINSQQKHSEEDGQQQQLDFELIVQKTNIKLNPENIQKKKDFYEEDIE